MIASVVLIAILLFMIYGGSSEGDFVEKKGILGLETIQRFSILKADSFD